MQCVKSVTSAAAARLIEYDTKRLRAPSEEAADEYAVRDRIDARRMPTIFVKVHSRIFAFETFTPLTTRMDDATHLHFPEQLIRRCAQLI